MTRTTHSARITGPIAYQSPAGRRLHIPLGPCLVEHGDGDEVDIFWGANAQRCAAVPLDALTSAEDSGYLVLLD
jgi:hypothetical protein